MKLRTIHTICRQTFYLLLVLVLVGSSLTQASVRPQTMPVDEAANASAIPDKVGPDDAGSSTPTRPGTDARLPAAMQALIPSIVSIRKIERADSAVPESDRPEPSCLGIVVDSRGYIAIPYGRSQGQFFRVRFENQQEAMGELVAVLESDNIEPLKVGMLKIESPLPVTSVSLEASREARPDERVLLVPSSAGQELRSGRILTNALQVGGPSNRLIGTDIACDVSDFGGLLVSEAGEPIGLVYASSRSSSLAYPMKDLRALLQAAIDKPQDAPVVRLPESQSATDPARLAQQPAADSEVPDISGFWICDPTPSAPDDVNRLASALPLNFIIRRSTQFEADFEYVGTRELTAVPRRLKWEPGTRRFRAVMANDTVQQPMMFKRSPDSLDDARRMLGNTVQQRELFELSTDGNQLSVRIPISDDVERPDATGESPDKVVNVYLTEQWRRGVISDISNNHSEPLTRALESSANQQVSKEFLVEKLFHLQSNDATAMLEIVKKQFQGKINFSGTYPKANQLIVIAPLSVCSEVEAFVRKLESTPASKRPADVNYFRSALPGTPAAKKLVEQLKAYESAAASEATTLRQLQGEGQVEQNLQAIDNHQRKLATLLSTAFDLKLQLEELQVQELRSRLSRLESQIGQRRGLRDRIIAHRVAELLNPDVSWETQTTKSLASGSASAGAGTSDYGRQDDMAQGLTKESKNPATAFYLKNVKVQKVVDLIQQLRPKAMDSLVPDDGSNSLLVRGDEKLIRDVEQLIKVMDAEGTSSNNAEKQPSEEVTPGSQSDRFAPSPFGDGSSPSGSTDQPLKPPVVETILRGFGRYATKPLQQDAPSVMDAKVEKNSHDLRETETDAVQRTRLFNALQSIEWPWPIDTSGTSMDRSSEQRWNFRRFYQLEEPGWRVDRRQFYD